MPTFAMFDGSNDPYDHMLHYNQAMTLNAKNDHLFCKVFSASLHGPMLAWFHELPHNSINLFNELWNIFVSHHFVQYAEEEYSLQTIIKQEEETIRSLTRRFGQAIKQVEVYSMDAVLQNFRRRFTRSTPFLHSLSLNSRVTMEELYKRADRYSTLEDNIYAAN